MLFCNPMIRYSDCLRNCYLLLSLWAISHIYTEIVGNTYLLIEAVYIVYLPMFGSAPPSCFKICELKYYIPGLIPVISFEINWETCLVISSIFWIPTHVGFELRKISLEIWDHLHYRELGMWIYSYSLNNYDINVGKQSHTVNT